MMVSEQPVLQVSTVDISPLLPLFKLHSLELCEVAAGNEIPGSHWGDSEAGLIGCRLFIRPDTPVHSMLHEACHFFLMDEERRSKLHTDAGGSATEENAVCYLQILLAPLLPEMGTDRMMQDMDSWGYSFRLGSTRAWFEGDAEDAVLHLQQCGFDVALAHSAGAMNMFAAQNSAAANT